MSSPTEGEVHDAEALLESAEIINSEDDAEMENLNELSQELCIGSEAMDTEEHELVVESQEEVEHEEEVVQSEGEIEPQEIEVQSEDQDEGLEEVMEPKFKPASSIPPLRPLNIAPKPEQVPIAVKSVGGQPLILVPGGSGGQAIKLVNPQGQEINLANYSLSRPITIKSTGKTITTTPVAQTQPKPIFMKKIITTTTGQKTVTKPVSFGKPGQQFVVVQKAGEQPQQVKLVQTAPVSTLSAAPVTKTITLQQAQEMGLLGNAKIVQSSVQQTRPKRTVLINKTQPKTIKLVPQGAASQVTSGGVTKTISLSQFKSPTKILPAATTNIAPGKAAQRLVFKSATGGQVLPAGQLIQVGGTQGIANGQIHQINVPGKGMQYIKFVTSTSGEPSNTTVTLVNTVKSTTDPTVPTAVVSEVKPIITATKLVSKPATTTKPTQVMLVPAGYIPANMQQVQKVAIPAVKPAIPQKHVLASVPRTAATVTTSSPETTSSSSTNTTIVSANETAANTNGIRPRKPCNCTKSQCLKLYCDCFANGEFCYLCNCMNCFNNLDNEETRNLAIKACLDRNSNAFRPKIGKAKDTTGDVLRKHTKGCNCKRSGCLKNYCECYEAKIACSSNCKCIGCRNVEDSLDKKALEVNSVTQRISDERLAQTVYRKILPHYKDFDNSRDSSLSGRRKASSRKQPITYMTDEVIEATCQCLLTISDDADSNMQDEEITKRQIIEEFGGCLNEIIHCSINRTDMKNTQHPVVVLHNASIEDVRAMLAFMYRGQCVVSKDQLPNLLSIAKLLKIQGLCDMKVPEKDVSAETIPLVDATDSKNVESKHNTTPIECPCDIEASEKDRTCESGILYNPGSISVKRHSSSSGYSTAINLSTDSKRMRLSSSPSWEKPLRETPEDISPCSTEDNPPPYPTHSTKKQPSPKEASETCKCFLCGKYLSNQYNLRVHMETHEEAYHACQSCPHVSRSRDALRKHVSYRHPEEYLTRKRKKTDSS